MSGIGLTPYDGLVQQTYVGDHSDDLHVISVGFPLNPGNVSSMVLTMGERYQKLRADNEIEQLPEV